MATEIIMPKVDMSQETGTFVEWLKKEGAQVNKGDPIFVITTDKAAIECESPADGILAGVTAKPDDVIPVTEVIGFVLAPGESLPVKAAPQAVITLSAPTAAETAPVILEQVTSESNVTGKVRITPLARRLAKELNMDLTQISGRGPRGRIHKADVLAFQKIQPAGECQQIKPAANTTVIPISSGVSAVVEAPSIVSAAVSTNLSAPIPLPDARRKQVIPVTGARKIIAERMAYSMFTAPHITLSLHVDMTEAIRLREQVLEPLKAQTGQRVSYTAILARAVATVLPRHPSLNASLYDGNIIYWEDIHLGIATSVEESLIVPVIREAQNCNLGKIVSAMADLTDRARNRRLKPNEMAGSTFTISNLGMFGIESFTAIINPPESAILAVGKMVDTPVKAGDGFVFRPMIQLTASADHRIADGVAVAQFLADLKTSIENPYLLI
jgi:pyruvate dehydrogenase E2 component (dihydrolipoamide acetyltransferase)